MNRLTLFSLAPPSMSTETDLGRILEEIRTSRAAGKIREPAVLELAPGTYRFDKGVRLTESDSGTPTAPLVIRAAPGARVIWTGSRPIEGFQVVQDAETLARLSPEARGHVQSCHLPSAGILNLGHFQPRGFLRPSVPTWPELFYRGERMPLARWPSEGFSTIRDVPKPIPDAHGQKMGSLDEGFFSECNRARQWKNPADILVFGYWAYDWASSFERIETLDSARSFIRLAPPRGLYGYRAGQRIRFLNVLEELNHPGQWVLEHSSGMLYFWPPEPLQPGEVTFSILEEPFLTLQNASHVGIEGISFQEARGTAVNVEGGETVTIERCRFINLGNEAVQISGKKGHSVRGCTISHTGDGGISIQGGDRRSLTPASHTVEHNHIHHVARITTTYVPAILAQGVGIRIAHNCIHDHPHSAIILKGNQILIEFNHLHHVCLETGDVGAIYLGRDYTFRENIIRFNYIHDTGGVGMGSMGIYNDDCVSGTLMQNNLFRKVKWAVFMGGGRDFVVEGNLFIECNPALHLDGRGLDPSPVWSNMVRITMKERLEAMNWRSPPYSTRYPELATLAPYYEKGDGIPPGNIRIAHNICAGGQWAEITWHATADMVTFEDNLVTPNTQWIELSEKTLRFRNPPPFPKGFQPFPFEKIGPHYP